MSDTKIIPTNNSDTATDLQKNNVTIRRSNIIVISESTTATDECNVPKEDNDVASNKSLLRTEEDLNLPSKITAKAPKKKQSENTLLLNQHIDNVECTTNNFESELLRFTQCFEGKLNAVHEKFSLLEKNNKEFEVSNKTLLKSLEKKSRECEQLLTKVNEMSEKFILVNSIQGEYDQLSAKFDKLSSKLELIEKSSLSTKHEYENNMKAYPRK